VAEAPQLMALQRRGVAIFGIAYKDKAEATEVFLKRHGNPFARIGRDPEGRAGMEFGLYGVPETYFIDGAGIVRARWAGALTDALVSGSIDPLLKKYA
jgi:cytochrome c biogenesis protein CcmG/thiol:disulfide interchange protein DsbE